LQSICFAIYAQNCCKSPEEFTHLLSRVGRAAKLSAVCEKIKMFSKYMGLMMAFTNFRKFASKLNKSNFWRKMQQIVLFLHVWDAKMFQRKF
jgi:hypothetical protein